jgi:PAS domain S-box-containing protein
MGSNERDILIVDDSLEDRTYLKHLLSKEHSSGWRFTDAETAEGALALAGQQQFDCVVLDHRLPDGTGLEVLERLRNASGDLKVPIVLLTSMGDETLAATAIKAGALDYISKTGLTSNIISLAIRNAINKFELIEQRKRAEDELRLSQQRLKTMAETVPEILFTHRADGYCDYISHRFYEYTGVPAGYGQGSEWMLRFHPEDFKRESAGWLKSIHRGEPYEAQCRLQRHDGAYRWFTARVVPVRENGSIKEWVGVAMDVHDQREARNELEQRTRDLQRSNEELQRFAYVISHDLQTPLRTVSSITQLLARRFKDTLDEETRELTGFVTSGVQRMSRLITDLLEYSQLAEQARHGFVSIDAGALARWATSNLKTQIEESEASITIDDPLPNVAADDQLARVFQNLIGNAIKYRGERRPEIRVSAKCDGDLWTFAVRDNGIGFKMEYADRIFGVFQRLHGAGEYEGTGIGLAICKRIVDRYGGRMWVESVPGEGSTFYFSIPD